MDRRDVLKRIGTGAALLAAAPLLRLVDRPARAAPVAGRPRFYLQIIPLGGMDAVHTLDPKTSKDVVKGIDIPYPASAIIDAGPARLAPSMRALARWTPR